MNFYCNNTWKAVVEKLKSDIRIGLNIDDIAFRRKEYGGNSITLPNLTFGIKTFFKEGFTFYILISLLISFYFLYQEEYVYFGLAFSVVLLNIIIRLYGANKRIKQIGLMENLNSNTVTVLREGREEVIKAKELVLGDIVFFRKDSLISADLRIIKGYDLKVSEKNVTGEMFLKEKIESKLEGSIHSINEMSNILFRGSIIKEGEGSGIVVSVGNNTYLGQILNEINSNFKDKNPLKKYVDGILNKYFLLFSLVGVLYPIMLLFLALIPFEAFSCIYYAYLKAHYKGKGIVINNISALLLINNIDVFFIDKVGSITSEYMKITNFVTNNKILSQEEVRASRDINIDRMLEILIITNNSFYDCDKNEGSGEISEIASLKFCSKLNIQRNLVELRNKRIFDVPMDGYKMFYSTLNKSKKGYRCHTKGEVDNILEKCTHIMIQGVEKEISKEDIELIKKYNYLFSVKGLKTEGLAYRSFSYKPTVSENIESNLVFLGVVAFENPIFEEIDNCILSLKEENIIPIMFTEDNKISASTLGLKTRFLSSSNNVMSGVELNSLSKSELLEVLATTKVFNRINSILKSRIVNIFNENKYKVMVTGENLGDLFSLASSEVSIARRSSPSTIKNLCDLYIIKDYLNSVLYMYKKSKYLKFDIKEFYKIEFIFLFILYFILVLGKNFGLIFNLTEVLVILVGIIGFSLINLGFLIGKFGKNK